VIELVNEQPRNVVMGQQRRLKKSRRDLRQIWKENNKEMAEYFAKINEKVPVVLEELTQEEDQRKIDDIWSNMSMNLPLPP
jgi:hypothetical protein